MGESYYACEIGSLEYLGPNAVVLRTTAMWNTPTHHSPFDRACSLWLNSDVICSVSHLLGSIWSTSTLL